MSTSFQAQITHTLGNKTKYLSELKKTFVRPLIQLAVKTIEQDHIEDGILDRISKKYSIPLENVDEYYSAIFIILKTHLRTESQSMKPTEFKQCLQELKLSPDCTDDLSAVLYGQKRAELISNLISSTRFYPKLTSCKWRIDITIASSALNRVLEPCIIMEWIFNNGERHIFELSLAKFHHLRHAVANILVEMRFLEQNTALKAIHIN
ncbi:COMM domain-containing protein 5 [Prorops nasuta]|uniref:COMM domain-containing protein 5 n=1 Tax=Prorops nasuta TaxID=863751 RepID=UPI0034CDCA1B